MKLDFTWTFTVITDYSLFRRLDRIPFAHRASVKSECRMKIAPDSDERDQVFMSVVLSSGYGRIDAYDGFALSLPENST